MKNNRSTIDIRVIRTQAALLEAVSELIQTKKLSCITITELCQKAKINRNTFYYHYNNVFELLNEQKQQILDSIEDINGTDPRIYKQSLTDIFKCLKTHPYFLSILSSPNCDIDFTSDIFEATKKKVQWFISVNTNEIDVKEQYYFIYCNAGCDAIITTWIKNGMKETPEEIAGYIWDTTKNGIATMMLNK